MSRFLSSRHTTLEPYTPGEQPRDAQYTKLNTNESPYPPSPAVLTAVAEEATHLNLYCDPTCSVLRQKAAALYHLRPENILPVNGSDEILYFAFLAFCDETHPMAFPDITYGFYSVYSTINHIPTHIIPLRDDFSIDYRDYCHLGENIILPNPNAPTGIGLSVSQIEEIVKTNPNNLVVIDEAYVDFGGESCIRLTEKYDNLLVTQTFSKSRSLAGARLGFGLGCESLIQDLNTIKYSINPYNVNRMTQAAGVAALDTNNYYMENCRTVAQDREYAAGALRTMGFQVLSSQANFLFARSPLIAGRDLYSALKEKGILVRHFEQERIQNFVRITVGTREQMDTLLTAIQIIYQERSTKS